MEKNKIEEIYFFLGVIMGALTFIISVVLNRLEKIDTENRYHKVRHYTDNENFVKKMKKLNIILIVTSILWIMCVLAGIIALPIMYDSLDMPINILKSIIYTVVLVIVSIFGLTALSHD